jgi:hypothetical protein
MGDGRRNPEGAEAKVTRFPVLNFVARYGTVIAIVAGLVPVALVAAWFVLAGVSPLWLIAGVVAGGFAFLMMKSYADLVTLILEMLLPQ